MAVALTLSAGVWAQPTSLRLECNDIFSVWNKRVVEAYAALGVEVECVDMPWARGAQNLASGLLDGTAIRAKEFGDQFPNLVRVEPPVTVFTILLYKRKGEDIDHRNWRSHSIVSLRGSVLSDQLLVGLDSHRAGSVEVGLKQLSAGRVDLLLGDTLAVPKAIEELGVTNVEPLYPPVATYPMHHYLNREYGDLLLPISQQLMERQALE
ncbi:hypothetical protein QWY82_00475 [Simiduia curdlanivorans]|uniref:Solute-binding protein family 3/N-terminal domain-containing protein n=1 Tax=Simiduia curdlanivorans TaxID=1492769 RepID=A0ABV8V3T1_9GAMM|nr:hypothetical protein [Simiduia curdlanivorans]MDN3637267.1 hypothetical protein [Simiduia curdlanivorans]